MDNRAVKHTLPAKGESSYPAIASYALIGDCHAAALVSTGGSIDWCCMPRMDSDSCFGRLLDWQRGGYFSIRPAARCQVTRHYLPETLVHVTCFRSDEGEVRLHDCFAMREGGKEFPHRQLLRVVEHVHGRLALEVEVAPRFDFGTVSPSIRRHDACVYTAVGSSNGLVISGDVPLEPGRDGILRGRVEIRSGRPARLSVQFFAPDLLDRGPHQLVSPDELSERLQSTVGWWRRWAKRVRYDAPERGRVLRSALVLKALTYAPTGAIVAAPTTSLPETPGGTRNWDYRFSWIRDSTFTISALRDLGCVSEADRFAAFIDRTTAGDAREVQVLFGVDGKRRIDEVELKELEGYRQARPVRVGNAASTQFQADVYGELLEMTWQWHQRGHKPDAHYWDFIRQLVALAGERWRRADRGIWEVRGRPRHFVHSKVMCWTAVDRGIKLAEDLHLEAPVEQWKKIRDAMRKTIERRGVDPDRKLFVQAFGSTELDAATLLIPRTGFVDYRDPRMVNTAEAIRRSLSASGLIRRYRSADGLRGHEGTFVACTFWLAECLARQGRLDRAHEVYERACRCSNDVGLFSEEYDEGSGEMLGNFPQGLTHLAHISAAHALAQP